MRSKVVQIALVLTFSIVWAVAYAAVNSGSYTVYSNSNGDIYLKANDRFVPIMAEVLIPILLPPLHSDLYLQNVNGTYYVSTPPAFNESAWVQGRYSLLDGDFNGDAKVDLFLHSLRSGYQSLFLTSPETAPAVTSFDANIDLSSSQVTGVSVYRASGADLIRIERGSHPRLYADIYGNLHQGLEPEPEPEPPIEEPHPYPSELKPVNTVGQTTSHFSVSGTGSAQFAVPVYTPPGINGLEPSIAFNYDNRLGDGPMGRGWAIGGFPAITRCGQRQHFGDGTNHRVTNRSTDRLCLNGNRLQSIAGNYWEVGSQYRLAVDDYTRVTLLNDGNGTTTFKAEMRDGSIVHFESPFSLNDSVNGYGGTLAWYASRIEDRFGNLISIQYKNSGATSYPLQEPVPDAIRYGGNIEIDFNYQDRLGHNIFVGGAFYSKGANRLSSVDIKVDGKLVREYLLAYGDTANKDAGRLTHIQECGYAASGEAESALCKEPLSFHWNETPRGFEPSLQSVSRTTGGNGGELFAALAMDWNGDQVSDLVSVRYNGKVSVRLGSAAGLGSEVTVLGSAYDPRDASQSSSALDVTVRAGFRSADVNSDGRQDLVYAEARFMQSTQDERTDCVFKNSQAWRDECYREHWPNATVTWRVLLSGEGGAVAQDLHPSLTDQHIYQYPAQNNLSPYFLDFFLSTAVYPIVLDVNGDSKAELMFPVVDDIDSIHWRLYEVTSAPHARSVSIAQRRTTGISATQYVGGEALDADGDGYSEVLLRGSEGWSLVDLDNFQSVRTYDQGFLAQGGDNTKRPIVLDVNGDGLKDILLQSSNSARVYFNTGYGRATSGDNWQSGFSVSQLSKESIGNQPLIARDFDGDGKDDLLVPPINNQSEWRIMYSHGRGFSSPLPSGIPYTLGSHLDVGDETGVFSSIIAFVNQRFDWMLVADFNGDGVHDAVQTDYGRQAWDYYPSNRRAGSAITQITDSLENNVLIDYLPASDNRVHTPDNYATFPVRDLKGAVPLVRSVRQSNGIGGLNRTSYHYEGGKAHLQGLGFLGFRQRIAVDEVSGKQTTTKYLIDADKWWFNGRVEELKLALADGAVLEKSYSYWEDFQTTSNTYATVLELTSASTYEVDGGLVSAVETRNNQFDHGSGMYLTSTTRQGVGTAHSSGVNFQEVQYEKVTSILPPVNDTENWLLGFVTERSVTETVYDNGVESDSKSSVTRYRQEPGSLRADQITSFANSPELQSVTTYSFDTYGNVTDTQVGGNPSNNFEPRSSSASAFLDNRFPTNQTNALNQSKVLGYDKRFGSVTTVTDIDSLVSTATYDAFGREAKSVGKDSAVTSTRYEDCSDCDTPFLAIEPAYKIVTDVAHPQTSGAGAPTVTRYFDSLGREILTETLGFDGRSIYVSREYDAQGRLVSESSPSFGSPVYFTRYSNFDGLDRPTRIDLPSSDGAGIQPLIQKAYQGLPSGGRQVTTTEISVVSDAESGNQSRTQVTVEKYNALGQLVEKTEGHGSTEQIASHFNYDAQGNLVRAVIDGQADQAVSWLYNAAGYLVEHDDPNAGSKVYTYDALGNLITSEDAKQQVNKQSYDKLNRRTTRTDNFGTADAKTTVWYYDQSTECDASSWIGQLCRVEQPGYIETYGYDELGRLQTTTTGIENGVGGDGQPVHRLYSTVRLYDAFSRVETLSYPNNFTVLYSYNNQGYLAGITDLDGNPLKTVTAQDAFGNESAFSLGNGLSTTQAFDPAIGMVQGITVAGVQNDSYRWYSDGSLYRRTDNLPGDEQTEVFGYDALDRLTSRTLNGVELPYRYDRNGNLREKPGVAGEFQYAETNGAGPHAVTEAAGISYQYDSNGNLVARGAYTVDYTSFNKPSRIESAAGDTSFSYGPNRSRYRQEVDGKVIYYIGGGLYEETHESGAVSQKSYVGDFAQHIKTASEERLEYVHRDHLGSVRAITDHAGNVLTKLEYTPFGEVIGDISDTTRGFTDHEHLADSGLIHMNGRVYDPVIGRFLSPDPILQDPYNSQNYNRYSYVWNNPLSLVDPSGYQTVYFGGAGMDGPYIPSQIQELEDAGLRNVQIGTTTAASPPIGNLFDAIDVFRVRDEWENYNGTDPNTGQPFSVPMEWSLEKAGVEGGVIASDAQFNLIGYSYGSLIAAQTANYYADRGTFVTNLVLVGSPISQEFVDELRAHRNIGNIIIKNLDFHGDPLRPGMSDWEIITNTPELGTQFVDHLRHDNGAGHFYYNPDNEVGVQRRRDLAIELYGRGLR